MNSDEVKHSQVLEITNILLSNIIEQSKIFIATFSENNLQMIYEEIREIESKNDEIKRLLTINLSEGIFSSIDKLDLLSLISQLNKLLDLYQSFLHKIDLYPLSSDLESHTLEMHQILIKMIEKIMKYISTPSESFQVIIEEIQKLENQADEIHRGFQKYLFSIIPENESRRFSFEQSIDALLEGSIDVTENLAMVVISIVQQLNLSKQIKNKYVD